MKNKDEAKGAVAARAARAENANLYAILAKGFPADRSACCIETQDGAVEVVLDSEASTTLAGRTKKGRITCEAPLIRNTSTTRHEFLATMGDGQGTLNITTRKGSIRIR